MLSLTIINSDNICSTYELDSTPGVQYRIGRSTGCEIALPGELHLSRVHCILTMGDACALLTDNNSSNGIFENDTRAQEILVLPGKQYRVGNCKLMLELIPDAPIEEAPTVVEPTYEELPVEEPAAVEPTYEELPVEEPAAVKPAYEELPVEEPAAVEPTYEELPKEESAVVEEQAQEEPAVVEIPTVADHLPAPKRKFIPPPPRKALVKRAAPRPFYTAAGRLNTAPTTAKPKELKHRKSANGVKVKRDPAVPASALGLPSDFELNLCLLNSTPTIEAGDLLRFSICAEEDCYFYLIQYDSNNDAAILVPGVGGAHNKLQAGQEVQVPPTGADSPYELYVDLPYGVDTILAIACTEKTDWIPVWQEHLNQRDNMSTLGEVERNTIDLFKEMEKYADAKWASAMLTIKTGE